MLTPRLVARIYALSPAEWRAPEVPRPLSCAKLSVWATSVDYFETLHADELQHIIKLAWLQAGNKKAPTCAAVSKAFEAAAAHVQNELADKEVAPDRLVMKLASRPSLSPQLNDEEKRRIHFSHFRPINGVLKPDLERVLDRQSSGWLNNQIIDAFMGTIATDINSAEVGAGRVYFNALFSQSIEAGGADAKILSVEHLNLCTGIIRSDTARTHAKREHAAAVLRAAREVYLVYNVDLHWALMRVLIEWGRIEVYDSTGRIGKSHARKVLAALRSVLGIETDTWGVVVYEGRETRVAVQRDSKSCGVFACVMAVHVACDASLPDIQSDVKAWRKYVAARATAPRM